MARLIHCNLHFYSYGLNSMIVGRNKTAVCYKMEAETDGDAGREVLLMTISKQSRIIARLDQGNRYRSGDYRRN